MTRRANRALAISLLAATASCQVPRFEGPQIQDPPDGFLIQDESFLVRRAFPDHELAFHTAWVHTDMSGVSVIYINGHPGQLTLEDVMDAQEGVQAAATDPDRRFGAIEPLTIDGREAWGWEERVASTRRGLVDVAYRAVIPYDTITFAIEFESGEPKWKAGSPDSLRAVVATFGIGRTTYNVPQIAMGVGAVLLLVSVLRARRKERDQRLRGINLVKIERPEEDAPDEGGSGTWGGQSGPAGQGARGGAAGQGAPGQGAAGRGSGPSERPAAPKGGPSASP